VVGAPSTRGGRKKELGRGRREVSPGSAVRLRIAESTVERSEDVSVSMSVSKER